MKANPGDLVESPTPTSTADLVGRIGALAAKHERNALVLSQKRPEGVMPRGGIAPRDYHADKERRAASDLRQAATLIQDQGKEIERLTAGLASANAAFEEYERKFYLAADRAEAAEAKLSALSGGQKDG